MRRWALNLLCAASIFLVCFLLYSYLRSYLPQHWRMEVDRGTIYLTFWGITNTIENMEPYDPASEKFIGARRFIPYMNDSTPSHFLGISSVTGRIISGMDVQIVSMPLWIPLLLSVVLAIFLIRARRRIYRRQKLGHCLQCGYDLRESKDKCPECGCAIAAAPAISS